MNDQIDLDLMPWAPQRFTVRGATGRTYLCVEWMPVHAFLRFGQKYAQYAGAEAAEFLPGSDEHAAIIAEVQQVAYWVLRPTNPGTTEEQIRDDFPGRTVFQFLSFLLGRYITALRRGQPASFLSETAREEIPTSTPTTELTPKQLLSRSTGLRSSRTSSKEPVEA